MIALLGLIVIFTLTILFHLLVLVKVIPYKLVWGGRLTTDSAMYKFEIISLLLNGLFLLIVLTKANYLNVALTENVLDIMLWIMFGLFCLNTLGNLLSKNKLEKMIFTPITILLAVCILVVLLG